MIGLAPAANIVVYSGPDTAAGLIKTYSQIVSDDTAKVISTSWGAVETAWNDSTPENECASGSTSIPCGGGGGISTFWSMPFYQSGAPASLNVISASLSSGTPSGATSGNDCRKVPDVSADADPHTGYVIYDDGAWSTIGGTSAAAPLWAAFMALVNASSGCADSPIGFANPALYASAASDEAGAFNDVTSGNNDITGTNGGLYPAGAGYSMATGLGSPVGSTLPALLCDGGAAPRCDTFSMVLRRPGERGGDIIASFGVML